MEPTNRRRVVRALEVTLGSGRPFSSYGPGLDAYPPTRFHQVGVQLPHEVVARRIEARYHQQMADGFLDEARALLRRPGGMSRTARQALGYAELIEHLESGRRRSTPPWTRPSAAPGASPAGSARGSGGTPASAGCRRSTTRSPCCRAARPSWRSSATTPGSTIAYGVGPGVGQTGGDMRLTKHHGLGNDFLVLLDRRRLPPSRRGGRARPVRPPHRHRRRRRHPGGAHHRRRAGRVRMELYNADGSRAEMSGNGIRCLAQALASAGRAWARWATRWPSTPTPACGPSRCSTGPTP